MAACGKGPMQDPPADGWLTECPSDAFCFSRPAGLVAKPVQAIDSLVLRYLGGGLEMTVDMGRYATSTAQLVRPTEETITIDGRPGRVLSAGREVLLIVAKVYDGAATQVHFSMTLRFDGEVQMSLARRVFQSITFKPRR
jgi:hypothetical protein